MRPTILRFIGTVFLALALAGFATAASGSIFFMSQSYNFYLLIAGVLAFAVTDLGPDQEQWFHYGFILASFVLTVGSLAMMWAQSGDIKSLALIFFVNATALAGLIYSEFIYKPA